MTDDRHPQHGPRGDRQSPPPPADEVLATELEGGAGWHRVRFWIAVDPDAPLGKPWYTIKPWPEAGDVVLAVEEIHEHTDKPGVSCGGYVTTGGPEDPLALSFAIKPSGHTLVSLDPLHLEASLGCKRCASHGFIREGRWIDA